MATDTDSASPGDVQLRADIDRSLRHPVMFFFTSGAAWLAAALVLGFIASVKTGSPGFLDDCSWMAMGRVYARLSLDVPEPKVGLLSIGQTTKRTEQIGFFGVGFKSVYA